MQDTAPKSPWNRTRFQLPAHIPTMISPEERRYLYWLAGTQWQGEGHIVEMGPWLGGSTFCLAEGMAASGIESPHRLHVFDNFVWRPFMSGRGGPELLEGASFEEHFRQNLAPHRDRILVHNAWLPDDEAPDDPQLQAIRDPVPADAELVTWPPGQPVEILFVDGAKSWQGMVTLLATFADALIPGRSLLVFQDYKYWGEYWVAVIVELLSDLLFFEHQLRENTVTFRLTDKIDRSRLDALPGFDDFQTRQLKDLIHRAGRRLAEQGNHTDQLIVELTALRMLVHKNDPVAAIDVFRDIESRWPLLGCGTNLEAARRWLQGVVDEPLAPVTRSKARRAADRFLRPLRC